MKEDVASVAFIEYASAGRPKVSLQDEDIIRGVGTTVLRSRDADCLAGFIGTGREDVIAWVDGERNTIDDGRECWRGGIAIYDVKARIFVIFCRWLESLVEGRRDFSRDLSSS